MKAFLSDRTSRDERTPDAWTMGDLGVAWNAEREARAILAVTEDDNGHSDPVAWPRVRDERPFPVGPVGTYGWERYGYDSAFWSANSRGALAEALAAFIEA